MLRCENCNKDTHHHYFMMLPVGYMVCNECGAIYEPMGDSHAEG